MQENWNFWLIWGTVAAALTRMRIADHGNLPENDVDNVMHICTVFSTSVGYGAVLATGMREDKSVSHRAVKYAFLVLNYVALLPCLTVSVVVSLTI